MKNILFIGSGNMASAITGGIINSSLLPAESIYLYDKNPLQYDKFHKDCNKVDDLNRAFSLADYVFLSIKPQNVKEVLNQIKSLNYENKVFVSICAGITIGSIEKELPNSKIIRTMPNTPLLLGKGVTALCKNANVSNEDFEMVKSFFSSSGYITEIEENDINSLTAITSSSPAYVYLFAKGILEGAKALNFNYEDTLKMICYTLIGSANMILSSNKNIDDLISMVKSPNGTTEKALNVFEDRNFIDIISEAMKACKDRAEELSELN